ncbi:MAG: hypothetical protein NTX13_03630 [Acidobacteria bacterium]|nr:hypothetical protein [Acidobacteriota bacterium]
MTVSLRLFLLFLPIFEIAAQSGTGLFEYDRLRIPKLEGQDIAQRSDAFVRGCAFAGPRGGQVNLVLVTPRKAKIPYAAVLFQHGGGQSMTNYFSEALVLARAGVVSMLTDAPARGDGVISEINQTKLDDSQRFQADVVVSLRMALDHLLQQKGVAPDRIGFVGHSYGAVAGGVLAGVEPRIRAYVLLGGLASEAEHIRDNRSPYWLAMRQGMTPDEFTQTLRKIEATDPAHFQRISCRWRRRPF